MRFHDLRHTFATMAISNGVDVNEAPLSSKLGYFRAGFALDSYTHMNTPGWNRQYDRASPTPLPLKSYTLSAGPTPSV